MDYLVARRVAYHEELEARMRSTSIVALVAWGVGALVSLLTSFGSLSLSGMSALDAVLTSAAVYALLGRVLQTG